MQSRRTDEGMGALISSIREQTTRLRRNLSSKEPAPPQAEACQLKTLIDALLHDNKTFHEEVDAYRQVLEVAVLRCRETQRQLELERLKNARLSALETQLEAERSRAQQAQTRSQRLKEKYLDMLEAVRSSVLDMNAEETQGACTLHKLECENRVLKEMLGLSREADLDSEGRLPAIPETDYLQVLQQYKQKKGNAPRSKSDISNLSKKAYLLSAGKSSPSSQESVWDNFFKAKEKGSKSPEEHYDQAEELK